MTKREKFEVIINNLPATTPDYDEIIAMCNKEIEMLANKKSGVRKPTPKQIENEGHMDVIVEVLSASTEPLSIAEIMAEAGDRLPAMSNQRMNALLIKLGKEGRAIRCEGKDARYTIPDAEPAQ